MAQRESLLETAAFLDSTQGRALPFPRDEARRIVEQFLDCAYDGVGKAPRHLDREDLHAILGHLLPARLGKRDPAARHAPLALRAYLEFLEERAILPQGYELRVALDEDLPHFLRAVETGKAHEHGPAAGPPQAPIVNRAEKVGRNDPCPCGSGKKFKQCCLRIGS